MVARHNRGVDGGAGEGDNLPVPKLVPIKCPSCGADMRVNPNDEVVTCSYCRTSCFVRRPGKAAPPPTPTMPVGQSYAYVDLPRQAGRGVAFALLMSGVIVLGVVGAIVASVASSTTTTVRGDDNGSDLPDGLEVPGMKGKAGKASANSVKAADMSQVDPADLIVQAIAVAKKIEPQSKLISAHFTELKRGLLDLTGASKGHVAFQYRWQDKSKPAGKDTVEGRFYVIAEKGHFNTFAHIKTAGIANDLAREWKGAFPLPAPRCTSAQAWAVAVKSGVPNDAITTVHWGKVNPFKSDQLVQWSYRVEGHDEHRREIDAASCRLLRNWNK